jgi:cytochrome c peroxidase
LPEVVKRAGALDPRELDRAVLTDPDVAELGRFVVTREPRDIGKFKTPSLRNVAQTAPYAARADRDTRHRHAKLPPASADSVAVRPLVAAS